MIFLEDKNDKSCWWKLGIDDLIYIYSEDLKSVKKLDLKLMATYEKNGKIFAYQFKAEKNSKEYKKLFKILGLKTKDEYKPKKIKMEAVDGKNIAKNKKKGD